MWCIHSISQEIVCPGLQEDQHLHLWLELQELHLAAAVAAVVVAAAGAAAEAAVVVAAAGVPIMVGGAEGQVN